jgi:(2Fe-2S) ferredoxin
VEGGVQKDSSFAVYVQLDLDRFYKAMDHESALDFVKKLSIDEKKIKMTAEIQKRSGTVIEDIVKAIDWKKVYTYDINEIIRAGVLPPVMIAQGILQMEPEEKISTIKFLSTYSDVDFELYNKIIEELRKLGEKIDSTADEKIKKDFSFLTTPEIIDKIVELTHETELNSDDVRELMARLDPNDIIALFERPDIRKDIVFSFDGVMVTKVENKKEDKKIQDKQKTIKKKLGSDRTIRWMLANEVSTRAELDYPNPKPSKEELREMPRWEKIYSKKEIAEAQKRLGIRQSDIKKFVDEHSEEEILRWIYEADADVENSIKKFITNRENFYKVSK